MPSTTPRIPVSSVADNEIVIDTRPPYTIRANRSRPFCGSTPNQCEPLIPPSEPCGTPPRSELIAAESNWYGPQPLSLVISGAATAISTTIARNTRHASAPLSPVIVVRIRRPEVGGPPAGADGPTSGTSSRAAPVPPAVVVTSPRP